MQNGHYSRYLLDRLFKSDYYNIHTFCVSVFSGFIGLPFGMFSAIETFMKNIHRDKRFVTFFIISAVFCILGFLTFANMSLAFVC